MGHGIAKATEYTMADESVIRSTIKWALAVIVGAVLVVALCVVGLSVVVLVGPRIVHKNTKSVCGGLQKGILGGEFTERFEGLGFTVMPSHAGVSDNQATGFRLTAVRTFAFCHSFCDGFFSSDGRLERSETTWFCE